MRTTSGTATEFMELLTGKAVNCGDGEGMQVPCTLHFKRHQTFIDTLNKELSGKAC